MSYCNFQYSLSFTGTEAKTKTLDGERKLVQKIILINTEYFAMNLGKKDVYNINNNITRHTKKYI